MSERELFLGLWLFSMFIIWAASSLLVVLVREQREHEEQERERADMWLRSITHDCREIHLPGDCCLCSGKANG